MTSSSIVKPLAATPIDRRRLSQFLAAGLGAAALAPILPATARAQSSAERLAAMLEPGPNGDRVLGNPEAPVTIVEYASMTCPHCARFHEAVLPELKSKYIDTGKARLIFREFPLDDLALIVAMLARCVEGDAFFAFVGILFKQQREWAAAPKEQLMKLSKQAGITEEGFDKCIANQEVLNGIGWERNRARNDFGVDSTPTIFVNGRKMAPGASAAEIGAEIDADL